MNPMRDPAVRRAIIASAAIALAATSATAQPTLFNKQHVTFKSGGLTLAGYVYRPPGNGPFPAALWNHGSEQNPGGGPQFDSVAAVFVPAGVVVFSPVRRGPSGPHGGDIREAIQNQAAVHRPAARPRPARPPPQAS